MNKTYVLANHIANTDSKIVNNFKKTFLGADIGIRSSNFRLIITLSTVIALGTLFGMYYLWRI